MRELRDLGGSVGEAGGEKNERGVTDALLETLCQQYLCNAGRAVQEGLLFPLRLCCGFPCAKVCGCLAAVPTLTCPFLLRLESDF